MMTDRRRKRPMMPATTSQHERSDADFHVVTIGDPGALAPRRRSASAGRSESWMSKVTTAMSHRIFSGPRLSGSRSTQVMPMLQGREQSSLSSGKDGSNARFVDESEPMRERAQCLREVSFEATLLRTAAQIDLSMVLQTGASHYPNVACDGEEDEASFEHHSRTTSSETFKCKVNTINVRTSRNPQGKPISGKGVPRSTPCDWNNDGIAPLVALFDEAGVQSATPILKDFFNRSAATTHRERAQLKESRREQHYNSCKERHARLRAKRDIDEQNQTDHVHRQKLELLRKQAHERRLQMRQEASTLKRCVRGIEQTAVSAFKAERERWEQEFEEDMETLGNAFRKIYATNEGATERPMTVAGLVVPEAQMQIQRDVVSDVRRIRTAAPKRWSSDIGFDTMKSEGHVAIMAIENSSEVDDVIGADTEREGALIDNSVDTIASLLVERAEMARRITQLEQQVHAAKVSVVVEAAVTPLLHDSFFI